jgi:hypothetical protein
MTPVQTIKKMMKPVMVMKAKKGPESAIIERPIFEDSYSEFGYFMF